MWHYVPASRKKKREKSPLENKKFELERYASGDHPRRFILEFTSIVVPPEPLNSQAVSLQEQLQLAGEEPCQCEFVLLHMWSASGVEPGIVERHMLDLPRNFSANIGGLQNGSLQGGNKELAGFNCLDVLPAEEAKIGLKNVKPESAVRLEMILYRSQKPVLLGQRREAEKCVEEDADPIESPAEFEFANVTVAKFQLVLRQAGRVALALGDGQQITGVIHADDAMAGLSNLYRGSSGADGKFQNRLPLARQLPEEERHIVPEHFQVRVFGIVVFGDGAVAFHEKLDPGGNSLAVVG
jgi:hypothetical protein